MLVYKIVNIVNNKIYFGITKCSISKRWNEHKCSSKNKNNHLYKAIRKYGLDNFRIELVKECNTDNEMYDLEIKLISEHKSNSREFGYNNSIGGEKSSKGKKLSNEDREKISKFQRTRIRKPFTLETKKKMSEIAKGRNMSVQIENSVKKRKGKTAHNCVSIKQYSLNGKFIQSFKSYTEASKHINGAVSAVTIYLSDQNIANFVSKLLIKLIIS